ncbi:hypothetical protein AMTR_s00085p00181210 [Amborella trichopoda]|uniref:Uncharacterized protein n=1 Tax=Amborella trichopoda TaxID=13333 RepID=W1P4A3_AMBTC|nr:hypothetical protein AMTR_s00085p00181210 [Amborella trichopoda]
MALQDDFELVRVSILYRTHLLTIDATLTELMAKETRKETLDNSANVIDSILTTPLHIATFNSTDKNHIANRKPFNDISQIQCNYCKGLGHIKCNRPIKLRKKAPSQGFTVAPAFAIPSAQTPTSAYLTKEDV